MLESILLHSVTDYGKKLVALYNILFVARCQDIILRKVWRVFYDNCSSNRSAKK